MLLQAVRNRLWDIRVLALAGSNKAPALFSICGCLKWSYPHWAGKLSPQAVFWSPCGQLATVCAAPVGIGAKPGLVLEQAESEMTNLGVGAILKRVSFIISAD